MVTKSVRTEEPAAPVQGATLNQAENLADLAQMAQAVDAGGEAGPAPAQAAELVQESTPKDLADVLALARDMAAPMVEAMGYLRPGQTREIWSDAALLSIAEPACEIMRRHGVGLGDALAAMGPYIGLVVGLAPPIIATYAAIQSNVPAAIAARSNESQQQQQPT